MSPFLIFNNLNFAEQIFGALVFGMTAWLAFDSYMVRRDFLTASRGVGFLLLVLAQVVKAFNFQVEAYTYLGLILYVLGLALVVWNLFLEKPVERPSVTNYAIFILPPIASVLFYFNFLSSILIFAVAFLSYRQYKNEYKKTLSPFIYSFLFIFVSSILAFFYTEGQFNAVWIMGKLFEFFGFVSLGVWVWQYLQLRLREQIMTIFFSFALLISIVVTLAFSMILVRQIQLAMRSSLATNGKTLDYLVLHLREESLSKARLFSSNVNLRNAMSKSDLPKIEKLATDFMEQENLGFLTITDKEGNVIMRAHSTTKRNDNLFSEDAVGLAIDGYSISTIDSSSVEKFSIISSSPIISSGKVVGVVLAGFPLDNPFVDDLKKITGLDVSVISGDTVVASTIVGPDGRTVISGTKITDKDVLVEVGKNGNFITLETDIVYKPYEASYSPLKNINNEIVGMMSVAKSEQDIYAIANTTNMLTLISVIVIMIILAVPILVFTKKLLEV